MEQAFPGTGHQSDAESELHQLKRENEILRQERGILKKAIAIFSKPQDYNKARSHKGINQRLPELYTNQRRQSSTSQMALTELVEG